jgi:CysZ protein
VAGEQERRNPVREFLTGIADLGRGLRLWVTSPRLMLLGAMPAVLVGAVWVGLLAAVLAGLDRITLLVTPFADDWVEPWRGSLRLIVGVAVLLLALVVAVLTFTAVTLTVGAPFYERISAEVERRLGDAPPERDEPLLRGLMRAARDGLALLLAGAGVGLLVLLVGLVPLVGAALGVVVGTTLGGWLLVVELTGTAFDARGYSLRQRRRMLGRSRARSLGLGVATSLVFLVPFGAILAMPAAVGAATMLSRTVLGAEIRKDALGAS